MSHPVSLNTILKYSNLTTQAKKTKSLPYQNSKQKEPKSQ